jgi:hypothetical protein
MTRLYFLLSLLVDLTTTQVVVFTSGSQRFVGIASPRVVKEKLEPLDPRFAAYAKAAAEGTPAADVAGEVNRRADIWRAEVSGEGTQSSPVFVTRRELERWLSPYMITQAVDFEPDSNAAVQMQRVLDWPMRFVPVLQNGEFKRVVDKQALTEQIARTFVREQVSRALSSVR